MLHKTSSNISSCLDDQLSKR